MAGERSVAVTIQAGSGTHIQILRHERAHLEESTTSWFFNEKNSIDIVLHTYEPTVYLVLLQKLPSADSL